MSLCDNPQQGFDHASTRKPSHTRSALFKASTTVGRRGLTPRLELCFYKLKLLCFLHCDIGMSAAANSCATGSANTTSTGGLLRRPRVLPSSKRRTCNAWCVQPRDGLVIFQMVAHGETHHTAQLVGFGSVLEVCQNSSRYVDSKQTLIWAGLHRGGLRCDQVRVAILCDG